MLRHVLEILGQFVVSVENTLGLSGIVLLMGIESACVPLPSEVIMPFAGFLVFKGVFSLWQVSLAGALGCVVGSWIGYYAGAYGGRPFVEKYGRFILFNPHDLDLADKLFSRYGNAIAFFSRLVPIIRTFIAFPAGMARIPLMKFSIYTFLGSLPWCLGLAFVGMKLGENWDSLHDRFRQVDYVIAGLILTGAVFWIRHHLLFQRKPAKS